MNPFLAYALILVGLILFLYVWSKLGEEWTILTHIHEDHYAD